MHILEYLENKTRHFILKIKKKNPKEQTHGLADAIAGANDKETEVVTTPDAVMGSVSVLVC